MAEKWKVLNSIRFREKDIEEIRVRFNICPLYHLEAEIEGVEFDIESSSICRRIKISEIVAPYSNKSEILCLCPFMRGITGPNPGVICSYPDKE